MTDYIKEYHSAVKGVGGDSIDQCEPLDRYAADGSVAVQHDIHDGMLPVFESATAVYAEPAWRNGYEKFMEKAMEDPPENGFERYMMSLNNLIEDLGVPAFVVGGKNNLNWLKPHDLHEVEFEAHNTDCFLLLWNGADPPRYDAQTVAGCLNYVADTYDTVLDPCAGTGRLARAMADRDKQFVCADVNGRCIRFIATDTMGHPDADADADTGTASDS